MLDFAVLGLQLDLMILSVFSNLNNSMILSPDHQTKHRILQCFTANSLSVGIGRAYLISFG